jgi:hypothetical protein
MTAPYFATFRGKKERSLASFPRLICGAGFSFLMICATMKEKR